MYTKPLSFYFIFFENVLDFQCFYVQTINSVTLNFLRFFSVT
jgi:hypothetical protein